MHKTADIWCPSNGTRLYAVNTVSSFLLRSFSQDLPAPNVLHHVSLAAKRLLLLANAPEKDSNFDAQGGDGLVACFKVSKPSEGVNLIRRRLFQPDRFS
jgi:hypothetical protein